MEKLTTEQIKQEKEKIEKEYNERTGELGKICAQKVILENHILALNARFSQLMMMEDDQKKVVTK